MAKRLGRGFVEFFLKKDRFDAGAKSVIRILGRMKASMMAVAGIARNILFAGAGAAVGLIKLAQKQIDAEAKLAAVIKATGQAAGFTAKELIKEAAALQKVTTFGDDVIINSQAILATFKEIKGDIFKDATVAMLDMSTVMDGDLKGAAIQLGKALNDPVLGISALSRVGVSFTEDQKESIKQFVAQNDVMSAQRIILKELKSEFGGAAAALARTDVGKFRKAMNQLSDAGERFGVALIKQLVKLIPHLERFSTWVSKLTDRDIEGFIEKAKTLGKTLIGVWLAPKLIAGIQGFVTLIRFARTAVGGLSVAVGGLATVALAALISAFGFAVAQGQKLIAISKQIEAASRNEVATFKELARLRKELSVTTDETKRLQVLEQIEAAQSRLVDLLGGAAEAAKEIKDTTSSLVTLGRVVGAAGPPIPGVGRLREPTAGVDTGTSELQLQRIQKQLGITQRRIVSLEEQRAARGGGVTGDRDRQLAAESNRLAAEQLAEQVRTREAIERSGSTGIGLIQE